MTSDSGRLDDLEAMLAGLRTRQDELELALDELASREVLPTRGGPPESAGGSSPAADDALGTVDLERLYEWVSTFWLPTFRREHNQIRLWCARWREHGEAVWRLEGTRRAWEAVAIVEPTGLGTWFRDYADPCLAALQSPDGPFAGCNAQQHRPMEPLPDAGISR